MHIPLTFVLHRPFYGSVDFVWDNPDEPVPEETFTHSHPSWSSNIPISLLHVLQSMASSLFNPRALQTLSTISLQVFFGLPFITDGFKNLRANNFMWKVPYNFWTNPAAHTEQPANVTCSAVKVLISSKQNNKLSRCWTHALLLPKCKTPHFPYTTGLLRYNLGSQDIMIRIGFHMQVAKTPTYPVMGLFQPSVAQCDHNPPTLQTDRLHTHSIW